MHQTMSIEEATAEMAECIRRAEGGDVVLMTRDGKAVVALVAATGVADAGLAGRIRGDGCEEPAAEAKSRWARAAEFFRSDKAGHLNGKSDDAMEYIRDFRRGFTL